MWHFTAGELSSGVNGGLKFVLNRSIQIRHETQALRAFGGRVDEYNYSDFFILRRRMCNDT